MAVQLTFAELLAEAETKIDPHKCCVKSFKREHLEREIAAHDRNLATWAQELARLKGMEKPPESTFHSTLIKRLEKLMLYGKDGRARVERLIADL